MNTQPRESLLAAYNLEVHSIFDTIQGEGPFAGTPAVFIRLTGCNIQCPWCDTDYTSRRQLMSPPEVVSQVNRLLELPWQRKATATVAPLVVITGGEPFRQRLGTLVALLRAAGYRVQIETNGTVFDPQFPFELATIVCSPKLSAVHKDIMPHLAALKYVLSAGSVSDHDGLPLATMGASSLREIARPGPGFTGEIYVQPLDEATNDDRTAVDNLIAYKANLQAAIASARAFGYRLCLQTHKLCGLE